MRLGVIKLIIMKKNILTFALIVISNFVLLAQKEATTKDGEKVILKNDGTWIYDTTVVEKGKIDLECSELISTETDKMTDKSTTSARKTLFISKDGGKTGFGIFLMKSSTGFPIFSIQAIGAGNCINEDDKMNVLFRDGTRLELTNDGKFNCKAKFKLYFGDVFGKEEQFEMFRTKEVEIMRVWTTKGYVERDFTIEQSNQLMKTIDCLMNNE